jgi:signal transduction histidine kinase
MEDLSLHLLDIVDNSLRAAAANISIRFIENRAAHTLTLEIEDDGVGMDDEELRHAMDPFFTTKNGKKIGIGLSLLFQAAEEVGGSMRVEPGAQFGIKVTAFFRTEHPDMKPLGDIDKTIRVLRATHPDVNISYEYCVR